MYKKLLAIFQLIRPVNFFITFFVIIVAVIISGENFGNKSIIFLTALSGALTASAGNIINDFFDINIDKINKPNRPLPSNKINKKEALFVYFFFFTTSIIISSFINIESFLIVFSANILLFFYSYKLKRILLVGNLTIAFLTGLAFVYGGVSAGNIKAVIIPALFAFLINLIREILKDIEDVTGDLSEKIVTFPAEYGIRISKKVILFVTVFLVIFTLIPFAFEIYKIEYFILVMIIVNPLLIYSIKNLFNNHSEKNLNKLSNILKLNMIFGLIAIYVGS